MTGIRAIGRDGLMKNSCGSSKQISAYLDGVLPEKEAAAVKAHLQTCVRCRAAAAAYENVSRLLLDMPEIEPSVDFDKDFRRKLEAENARASRWRNLINIFSPLGFGWRPAAAAMAAVFLIAGGVAVFRAMPPAGAPSASVSEMAGSMNAAAAAVAEDLDFYQDMDLISRLDLLEEWEALSRMGEI
jgi:anti-sigma factor RsiW